MSTDPYRYFRIEAKELLESLSRGVLELETAGTSKEIVSRLLRLAHTLKGASRVVKQSAIGDLAHAAEDVLAPYRDGEVPLPKERINEILRLADAITERLAALEPPTKPGREHASRPAQDEPFATVRIEIGEMDALLQEINAASAQFLALRSELEPIDRIRSLANSLVEEFGHGGPQPRDTPPSSDGRLLALAGEVALSLGEVQRTLASRVDHVSRELLQVRERSDRLRLVPASAIFPSLERAVRDAAQALEKRVEFRSLGGETHLDAHVLAALRDALLHVARNSVAHGVEAESERVAAGKPPAGEVEVRVERRGNLIAFICRDDGRGIDMEAVRKAAVRKGLISPSEAWTLGPEDAIRLILTGGMTTTGVVTDVSGRGVGLEAVRETVARLKGHVSVHTERGRGTTFEISVPVSLSSIPSISLDAGGIVASFPLDALRQALRLRKSDLARSGDRESVLWENRSIPFAPLGRLLGLERQASAKGGYWTSVVVSSGNDFAAVGVERVLGIANVIVRPLPPWIDADQIVAGAALDPEGSPQLVLNPREVVAATLRYRGSPVTRVMAPPRVLVIDDSLTTRMLEQSILESSGYEVDTATSGEEALAKARRTKYALFIVDIEMPGIDGFEFISQTTGDQQLREVPSILVTSRASEDDRRRGEEVGAQAYIPKSEFDQGRLLAVIRELIG